ncbi:MAG: ubiquinol-cytochrome C chaperone family protein [Pseudomonadota bacterium]
MILSLFRPKKPNANKQIVDDTFEAIVAAARQPTLYADWGIPDTPLGRYESLSLHMILFLHRTRNAPELVQALAQDVVDEFFKDIDHSVRELGVGDAGVPKRMKKLGKMFYGRMGPYWEAIDANDLDALSDAITRNISPVSPEAAQSLKGADLAAYAMAVANYLSTASDDDLLKGRLAFQTVEGLGLLANANE